MRSFERRKSRSRARRGLRELHGEPKLSPREIRETGHEPGRFSRSVG